MRKKTMVLLSWGAVLLLAVVIFLFSAQPAKQSSQVSTGLISMVCRLVVRWFHLSVTEEGILEVVTLLHYAVRKAAHMTLYFLLGVAFVNAWWQSGLSRACLVGFCCTVAYAITDEFHQLFVPGRSGEITDVLIDALGAGLAALLFSIWQRRRNHVRS